MMVLRATNRLGGVKIFWMWQKAKNYHFNAVLHEMMLNKMLLKKDSA